MYLLDFYGTLFDGVTYEAYLKTRTSTEPYAPGELSQFLYEDAARFLREKENSAMIVTSASKEADALMVQSALHGIPRTSVMYTNGVLKGQYLAPYISMYGATPVFVDDSTNHLASMETFCPDVQLFLMCRTKDAHSTRWPIIHSLSELP